MVKSWQLLLKHIHQTSLNCFAEIPSIISLKSLIKRVTVQNYEVNARLVICWWELLHSGKSTNCQYHYVCANQVSYYYILTWLWVILLACIKNLLSSLFPVLVFVYDFIVNGMGQLTVGLMNSQFNTCKITLIQQITILQLTSQNNLQ